MALASKPSLGSPNRERGPSSAWYKWPFLASNHVRPKRIDEVHRPPVIRPPHEIGLHRACHDVPNRNQQRDHHRETALKAARCAGADEMTHHEPEIEGA